MSYKKVARKKVAIIPGEGAAAEAVHATMDVLTSLELNLNFIWIDQVEEVQAVRHDHSLWVQEMSHQIDATDAALFGACAEKYVDIINYLRWGKNLYANYRPFQWIPGFNSPLRKPEKIDFVVVRENLEDLYVGIEGEIRDLDSEKLPISRGDAAILKQKGLFSVKIVTEEGTRRIARFAGKIARQRKLAGYPGKISLSTKKNVIQSDLYFSKIVKETLTQEYPELHYEEFIIDDCAKRIVATPEQFDVLLFPNLYGDILSDEAAAIVGGLGLCGSGCYGENYAYFESVHGAALDLVGKGTINPTATLMAATLLFEYLDLPQESHRLRKAIQKVYSDNKVLPVDQGGHATTQEFCDEIKEQIKIF